VLVVLDAAYGAAWHAKGTVGSVATIRRPDAKTQVTYRGRPLYSFYQDGRGDANGEGFKDVGTWHAVVPG
jgi:predicted lipoprotein with Yx(FWY)xxD motif